MSSSEPCNPGPCPSVKFRRTRAHIQALPAGAILLPGIAGVASITLFLANSDLAETPARAYALGTAIAAGIWFLLPLLLRRYAYVDRSNPTVYAQLVELYSTLRLRAERACREGDKASAVDEACRHLVYVGRQLGLYDNRTQPSSGLRWVLATGYIDLWRRLHRSEEALILADPPARVIGDSVYDDQRLDGSRIASVNHLRIKLSAAVDVLGDESTKFLNPAPGGLAQQVVSKPQDHEAEARSVLRAIRRTINEFRDDRKEGLVRARNNLYATVIFAGLVAYLLLGLAMVTNLEDEVTEGSMVEVSKGAILAAAAFYLVGALVGLFRVLHAARAAGRVTEEDYGLNTARLIHTPLFAGIAAVAGAALVKVLPTTLPDKPEDMITLTKVFDLREWPEGLVFAAVFGLTPTLLFRTLERRAEQYKQELKTSEAGEQTVDPP